jgi:L-rhamnose mutarotase
MNRRICLALDLVNDAALIDSYVRMHEPGAVRPAVINHIRAQGVLEMEIWQRGDRLFMIIEAADDYPRRLAGAATLAENDRWESLMETFQRPLPGSDPDEKWSPMQRIFCLADHAPAPPRP